MEPERDWKRLGDAFAEARKAADLTQVEVAERLSVTRTPIQAIERGRQANGSAFTKVTATMRAYARLLGWTEDSPARILRGEEPEPASQPTAAPGSESGSDLPPAVDRELRSGKTLDHTVVHLGGEDDDTRIIVVLKGAEDISEEELDELWKKWSKTRRHIQAIPGESDTPQDS
ncbi:helix-turn-helix transcriptional regulator [Streptomyces bangladeshensis]|uniref:HTH cro/C1-type domain-containing protein n=1 Tax=Streptomyces bangladeshensis TaxID=295352 RepID=A0ABN3BCG8_9ACTN